MYTALIDDSILKFHVAALCRLNTVLTENSKRAPVGLQQSKHQ